MKTRQPSRTAMFAAVAAGFIMLAGCASVRPGLDAYNHYAVVMSSQQSDGHTMTLSFEGQQVCAGEVARNTPVKCDAVAYTPRHATVTWTTPGGGTRVVPLNSFYQFRPRWFRAGDMMAFTLTRYNQLSVVFVCRRPGNVCTTYPPFTAYGVPIGYDLGYAVGGTP